jgi:hypothetical protein
MRTPSWQRVSVPAARAVVDVPSVIAAARHTNAQANSEQLVMRLINFVFIGFISFFLSL